MAAAARVALALMVVTALAVATCSAVEVGLYIHLQDSKNVEVFQPLSGANVIVPGFGVGRVFDYPVTTEPTIDAAVVGRAQGLYYHASNEAQLESFQEQFNVLFQDRNGKYTGTSFSFGGVWASGYPHEFFFLGGSGTLKGNYGATITLVRVASYEGVTIYSLDVEDYAVANRVKSVLLANRVLLNTLQA